VHIKLREIELKVQREINEKRQELLAKEESLRYVETSNALLNVLLIYFTILGISRVDWPLKARRSTSNHMKLLLHLILYTTQNPYYALFWPSKPYLDSEELFTTFFSNIPSNSFLSLSLLSLRHITSTYLLYFFNLEC